MSNENKINKLKEYIKTLVSEVLNEQDNETPSHFGGGENIIGDTVLTSGDFKFPVMIKSERAKITIESESHLPCQFLSAEWEGNIHLRAKRR